MRTLIASAIRAKPFVRSKADLLPETTVEPDCRRKVIYALRFTVGLSCLGPLAAVT